ncbi:hypothetical protein LWC34_21175 [Kibdelosporangium philippinense]|uniref:Uncharacterized protein n=1 Tax=Kibdelosporangium philippinense TaxID=211113 RepID=A0ABS8ZF54_9PSEU|nr:hypothetical protein [Kibdelosporangium philippinense]MCE7005321.1 hypothetical protein [Kibdelosporangium philippinense]
MSEAELREGLKLAVADEPPMVFDLDELVDTAERMVRRRRALVAVGVSTAAVAVVAVAVPVFLGIGGTPPELPQAAPPAVTITTSPPKAPMTVAQLKQRGEELMAHLKTQVPVVVPDAKNITPGEFGGEASGQFWDGQTYLDGFLAFTLGDARTAINVQVNNAPEKSAPCTGCRELPQADGSKVVIRTESGPAGNAPDMKITSAEHYRTDGSVTRVSTYNYDPVTGPSGYQPNVALTDDQLVRLATDPALHM